MGFDWPGALRGNHATVYIIHYHCFSCHTSCYGVWEIMAGLWTLPTMCMYGNLDDSMKEGLGWSTTVK